MNLIPFEYETHEVRVIPINGEPHWVAKDVCDILEIKDNRVALRRLDEDEKGECKVPTLGGMQKMSIINESGLWSLVLRSKKPEAKAFKKWLTSVVLPTLRKTGRYDLKNHGSDRLARAAEIHEALGLLISEAVGQRERIGKLEDRVDQLERQGDKALPMAAVEVPSLTKRAELNQLIRQFAKLTDLSHQACWNTLYDAMLYRVRVDVRACAKHRGVSKIQYLETAGLLPIACALVQDIYADTSRRLERLE